MTMEKKRVLLVDDCADDIHVLLENLKQDYAVTAATRGDKALALAGRSPPPDVILLDVMMPDMDGYTVCRHLKGNTATQDIDVIFISAHDTSDEKLAGYAAGGSDYLIKPVQPEELLQKVKLAIGNKAFRIAAASEKQAAVQTAMIAMSSAGEQGVVLDFMRNSFAIDTVQDLATLVVEASVGFGLATSVQIRSAAEQVNVSSTQPMPPLEQELLFRLKDSARIWQKDARLFLNFGPISQLIRNMPEDEAKSGRLRDHLAMLLDGAVARLRAIELNDELAKLVADSKQALQEIGRMQEGQKKMALRIMDDMMKRLEESFLSYGLSEDQEARLFKVVQAGIDKSLENFEQGLKIDGQLHEIVERMARFSVVTST